MRSRSRCKRSKIATARRHRAAPNRRRLSLCDRPRHVREVVEAYLLPPKTTLSTPALEALAIVAHMQPVTKGEIEAIRGVNSDSVVSTLLDRGLIAEAGRKDVVGRPMTYKTTPLFLESFGLRSLDDLPQLELEPGQPLELNLILLRRRRSRRRNRCHRSPT